MAKRVMTELSLPESLIQYIQSFLSGKEAARTTVLNKSWYTAWLTRPNVEFNQTDFDDYIFGDPEKNKFARFSKRTLQRYEDLSLKIDTFKLRISGWERAGYALADELIVKAIKIGATDIEFELTPSTLTFCLPHAVLGSENLTRLTVTGCKIENGKVSCSKLKSVFLREVWLEGDMIWDVLSSCPLIEDLFLQDCKSFTKIMNPPNTNFVTGKRRMLALSPSYEMERRKLGRSGFNLLSQFELHKLKCLFLEKVKISTVFFADFSIKFPCLKELVVHYCFGYKEIYINSESLEVISFAQKCILKATFDVPSMKKFSFSGRTLLPLLAFNTVSEDWESDISICCKSPSYSWFLNLNKLLTNLSSSTISLSIDFQCGEKSFDFKGVIEALPIVENLTLHASNTVYYALLDGIFWSCRPTYIYLNWLPGLLEQGNENLLELLFKSLTRDGRAQRPYLYDLVEAFVVHHSAAKRRPMPVYERTICFKLAWEEKSSI